MVPKSQEAPNEAALPPGCQPSPCKRHRVPLLAACKIGSTNPTAQHPCLGLHSPTQPAAGAPCACSANLLGLPSQQHPRLRHRGIHAQQAAHQSTGSQRRTERPVQQLRLGPRSTPRLSVMLHRTWQAAAQPGNQAGPCPAALKGRPPINSQQMSGGAMPARKQTLNAAARMGYLSQHEQQDRTHPKYFVTNYQLSN